MTCKTSKLVSVGKNNNTPTVQAEFSKFAILLFDQWFQIASVPEPIGTLFCGILHRSDCCLFYVIFIFFQCAVGKV